MGILVLSTHGRQEASAVPRKIFERSKLKTDNYKGKLVGASPYVMALFHVIGVKNFTSDYSNNPPIVFQKKVEVVPYLRFLHFCQLADRSDNALLADTFQAYPAIY